MDEVDEESQEPVVVWVAPNQVEAQIIVARLQSEGVTAAIQGESAALVFGFTTGGIAEWEVIVPASLVDQAVEILGLKADSSEGETREPEDDEVER